MPGTRGRRIRRVAVLIESSRGYGRGLIEGVARFGREQGTWTIFFEPRGLGAPPPWLKHWEGDGILTRLTNRRSARIVAAKGIPVVDMYATAADSQLPMVAGDNERIARLAFEHLWERGLRQFGYCGEPPGENRYMTERGEIFRGRAEAAGCPCSVFHARTSCLIVSHWEKEQDQIAAWLKGLPKPVGVMACFDERGFQVLNTCAHAGLRVPEEVAVISVGSDNLLCELSTPPMSSIDLDAPGSATRRRRCSTG